jgi:hypothetical protein
MEDGFKDHLEIANKLQKFTISHEIKVTGTAVKLQLVVTNEATQTKLKALLEDLRTVIIPKKKTL